MREAIFALYNGNFLFVTKIKATEINLLLDVNQMVYAAQDNADLKAYSSFAHVNPGLENGINKLITQHFCTCVIPFVMLKRTAGGWWCWDGWRESRCVVGRSRLRWILPGILFSCRVCAHVPTSIFNVGVFCLFPCSVAWGVVFLYI